MLRLLSATPVNSRFVVLKNQLALTISFDEIYRQLSALNLGIYAPSDYILASKRDRYEAIYGTEILELVLKEQRISQGVLEIIDREIPYHLVFILKFQDLGQIWISYKEGSKSRQDKFKIDSYYHTEWFQYDDLALKIEGLDLDKVYENFILQVAGDKLKSPEDGEDFSIKESAEQAKEKKRLEKELQWLEAKIKKEKQFNRQVELMGEIRKLKNKLGGYQS